MIARTLTGSVSTIRCRLSLLCSALLLVMAVSVAFGYVTGQSPATAAEGDEPTIDGDASGDFPDVEPTPVAPTPTELPLDAEPVETAPEISEPPDDAPADDFVSAIEPSPTESPVVEPVGATNLDPTLVLAPTEPVSSEGAGDAVRAAAESTAIEIGDCEVATGSSGVIGQAGTGIYGCAATIAVANMPMTFAELVLDWGVVAEITPGWTAELRLPGEGGAETGASWTPGAAPGLGVVEHLGVGDDLDGNPDDGVFSYEVRFEVRLIAPACGGPISPDIVVTPSVLPTIDGIEGWRRHGEPSRRLGPTLAVAAPAPTLTRLATGELDDANAPIRFSHADQAFNAGSLEMTVTSGYCGGWSVSISASDFRDEGGGASFGPGNLSMAATGEPSDIAQPLAAISLSNAEQTLVAAPNRPLPVGTYTYSFDLVLTIPGGTPSGTYTSTITVTTSAAP